MTFFSRLIVLENLQPWFEMPCHHISSSDVPVCHEFSSKSPFYATVFLQWSHYDFFLISPSISDPSETKAELLVSGRLLGVELCIIIVFQHFSYLTYEKTS